MLPCEASAAVGLRPLVAPPEVLHVVAVLEALPAAPPGNWSAREKHYRERLKGGDVLELAAVVRDLSVRAGQAKLTGREQELHDRARRHLAAELGHALGLNAERAAQYMDDHIARAAARTAGAARAH